MIRVTTKTNSRKKLHSLKENNNRKTTTGKQQQVCNNGRECWAVGHQDLLPQAWTLKHEDQERVRADQGIIFHTWTSVNGDRGEKLSTENPLNGSIGHRRQQLRRRLTHPPFQPFGG